MFDISGYRYSGSDLGTAHDYLLPTVQRILKEYNLAHSRIFDLGCGNGSVTHRLSLQGLDPMGVDPSETGITMARKAFPEIPFHVGSSNDQLSDLYGTFPAVLSLEVIEHVYSPRQFASCVKNLLEPGGIAIISTPYHGYLKNLALAVSGKMDDHFTALWDNGHIKFWSVNTLTTLFSEQQMAAKSSLESAESPCWQNQ